MDPETAETEDIPEIKTYFLRKHPLHAKAFQIMKQQKGKEALPVGEYVVMDKNETAEITNRKVALIQKLLNAPPEKRRIYTGGRQHVAFQRLGVRSDKDNPEQILFYTVKKGYDGEKIYKESGLLSFSKEEAEKWA